MINDKIAAFILLTFAWLPLTAGEYAVICNKEMKDLSSSQIKGIFLKRIAFVDEERVIAINLEAKDPLRLKFEKEFLHMSFRRLKKHWIKQHYLGSRPPISMKSQESINTFVKKVDGAIGYVEIENVDDGLKIIYKWSD